MANKYAPAITGTFKGINYTAEVLDSDDMEICGSDGVTNFTVVVSATAGGTSYANLPMQADDSFQACGFCRPFEMQTDIKSFAQSVGEDAIEELQGHLKPVFWDLLSKTRESLV